MTGIAYADVAGVDVPALVRLAEPASALALQARRRRARHGGAWLSPFKGRGMEFDEVRPYEAGDDVRSLDWKVTARTGEPFTKLFREERERPVLLCVDLRAAMFFATRGAFKSVVAAYTATLLAWSAARAGDRVGALLFADGAHDEVKPQRGRGAVLHFINRLAAHPAWRTGSAGGFRATALGDALARLRRVTRPGSLVFVISDLRGLGAGQHSDLVGLGRHNDVMLLHVYDPVEAALPPPGRYALTDGRRRLVIDSADAALARGYAARFEAGAEAARSAAARAHAHHALLCTSDDPLATLQGALRRRPQ